MKSSALSAKNVIILGIVIVAVVMLYFYFEPGSSSATGSLLQGQPGNGGAVGSAELTLLNQVDSLKIDATVLNSPVYKSLQDYSVAIPTENVGRANPFSPFPGSPIH